MWTYSATLHYVIKGSLWGWENREKTRMKKVLLSFLLPLLAVTSRAEQALVVYTSEGRAAVFVLSGEPRITCSAEEVTVVSDGESVSYALSALDRFALEDVDLTGIAQEPTASPVFRVGADGLRCEGLAPGQRVQVYDLGGRLVRQSVANVDGSVSLPMSRGTYVIKAGNQTFKTLKR